MSILWNFLLVTPLLNILVAIFTATGSLGISIIILTIIIRSMLIPVILPSIKSMKKQRELAPEIEKLKKKYKKDKQKLAQAQMELFKKHEINPTAGCLSQIAMIVVIFALFRVIRQFTYIENGNIDINAINSLLYIDAIKFAKDAVINTKFLFFDLAKPDPYYVLATASAVLQFIISKMNMPSIERSERYAKNTPSKSDDMAVQMQHQMMYMMPIMNFVIGVTLPAGVVLYILTTTIFTIIQTYAINGLGGLKPWINKLKFVKKS